MAEFSRQSLKEAIDAVRASRDACAKTASSLRDHGASRLAQVLDSIAAEHDRDLAQLLKEDSLLTYRAEHITPSTPGTSPAK